MSVRNLIVSPQDGWVEVANTGSGFVTAGGGLQHCIYAGTPPNVLVGHRYARKPIQYSLSAGESLWARASQSVFVVVTGEGVARSEWYLLFDEVSTYCAFSAIETTRIVMDVLPTSGNSGLPTGAPSVVDGVYQTIDFVYSGFISEIGRNGASYFGGVIANIKLYNGDDLVLDCALDQKGSNTQTNKADFSNPITLYNVNHDTDWFENIDGKLLGGELITDAVWVSPFGVGSQWAFNGSEWVLSGDGSLSALELINPNDQPDRMIVSGVGGVSVGMLTCMSNVFRDVNGAYTYDTNGLGVAQYKRWDGAVTIGYIEKPSWREYLGDLS